MKTNELRFGNYVYDTLGKVNKIDLEAITYIAKETHNQVKPIPLTEEWLLKFGFLKDLENGIYLNINAYAFLYWQNNRVELLDNDNNFMISHCNYVHQLQNLYFALTGKELTFKSE